MADDEAPVSGKVTCATCYWYEDAIEQKRKPRAYRDGGVCCWDIHPAGGLRCVQKMWRCHHHSDLEPVDAIIKVNYEPVTQPCPICGGRGIVRHPIGKRGPCGGCGGTGRLPSENP